jgi:hypothetical protein
MCENMGQKHYTCLSVEVPGGYSVTVLRGRQNFVRTTSVAPKQQQTIHQRRNDNQSLLILLRNVGAADARLSQLQLATVAFGPVGI